MSQMRAWNIRDLSISLNAVPLEGGYADDEVMQYEPAEAQYTVYTGADGEVSRAATNNGTGMITLKYAQTSAANDRLSALLKADLGLPNGAGAGVYSARDKQGRLVIVSERAWVIGWPTVTLGKTIKVNEWKIQLADGSLSMFVGGR